MFVKFLNLVYGTQGMELNFFMLYGNLGIYDIFSYLFKELMEYILSFCYLSSMEGYGM